MLAPASDATAIDPIFAVHLFSTLIPRDERFKIGVCVGRTGEALSLVPLASRILWTTVLACPFRIVIRADWLTIGVLLGLHGCLGRTVIDFSTNLFDFVPNFLKLAVHIGLTVI